MNRALLLRDIIYRVFSSIILGMVVIVMVYPFVWMISASFKTLPEMLRIPPTFIPEEPTLHNYSIVAEKIGILGNMYKNSLLVASLITVAQVFTCSTAAFVFARMKFPGKNLIFTLFISSLMVPAFLTVIPNFITMKHLGLIDSLWSIILLSSFSAFGIFLIRQFFMSVPRELHDAARIDGCNFFQSFFLIHLPLARSIIAINSILTFNAAWGDFFTPLIFLKSLKNMTLPLGISLIQGVYNIQSPAVMVATLVLSILPVIIVFFIGRRQLIESIAMVGLKR